MKAEAQNHSQPHATRSAATRVFAVALFIVFSFVKTAFALSWWRTTAPCTNWASVACSADGTKVVATVGPQSSGGIYRSTDSGTTWTPTSAPITNWSSIASSADGTRLLAAGGWACGKGPLYVSTNSGATWTQTTAPIADWCSVASSADGKRLVAVGFADPPGPLGPVISSDFGVTWTRTSAPFTNGYSVTSSADGQQLAAVTALSGNIFISTNAGSAWNMAGPLASASGHARLSGDGRILVADSVQNAKLIYVSTNLGTTWTTILLPVDASAHSITSSADGRNWVLAEQDHLLISTNYATTWDIQPGSSLSLASSADGNSLVAASAGSQGSGGYIYTSFITSPLLSISHSGNAFRLSWPWLIDGFAVQTTSDLALTNWSDVQATPSLSNAQYQVTLPATNSRVFFRLRHP